MSEAQKFVLEVYPDAYCGGAINGLQEDRLLYWIDRVEPYSSYLGYGYTEEEAWEHARNRINRAMMEGLGA